MSGDTIAPGKYVSLTYTIVDEAGNVVEQNDLPVSYVYGGEVELIGGMDQAVRGKRAGDVVRLTVPPEKGFGAWDPELAYADDIENVPLEFRRVGAEVQMQNDAGDVKTFHVTKIEDGRLTVDGNHPLAGKTLTVTVKVLEVRDAEPDDLLRSTPQGKPSIN